MKGALPRSSSFDRLCFVFPIPLHCSLKQLASRRFHFSQWLASVHLYPAEVCPTVKERLVWAAAKLAVHQALPFHSFRIGECKWTFCFRSAGVLSLRRLPGRHGMCRGGAGTGLHLRPVQVSHHRHFHVQLSPISSCFPSPVASISGNSLVQITNGFISCISALFLPDLINLVFENLAESADDQPDTDYVMIHGYRRTASPSPPSLGCWSLTGKNGT